MAEIVALKAKLGKTSDDDDPPEGKSVPYHRFQQTRSQLADIRREVDAIQAKIVAAGSEHAKALKDLREEAARQVASQQIRNAEDLGLVEVGIKDPKGRDLIREYVATLPEGERKGGPAAWYQARQAARAAATDPTKAPPTIPWLAGYEAAPAGPERKDAPNIDAGTGPRKPLSAESIYAMSAEDFTKFTGGV